MIADLIRGAPRIFAGEIGATPDPLADWWYNLPGVTSTAGITVTPDSALQLAAVFACVRVLAETLASFSLHVYERTETNGRPARQLADDHPLQRILAVQPNRWQTSVELHEMLATHLALRGNAYCEIVMGPPGQVAELIPRHPDKIAVEQLPTGRLRYTHYPPEGRRILSQDSIWHVRLFSQDGVMGMGPIQYARNAIGLASAAETHGAAQFKNGTIPPYYIKHPGVMKAQAIENFRKGWKGMHAGPENVNNPPILEEGMEMTALGVTNEDSQWIESRKFSTVEIARVFRVPPHLIADLERATFSNIEEMARGFLLWTMLPWIRRFEQTIQRDLIADDRYFAKYAVKSLMRADPATQGEFYRTMFGIGAYTINDILEWEDMNPIGEEGDRRFVPLNMAPLDKVDEFLNAKQKAPAPFGGKPAEEEPPAPRRNGKPSQTFYRFASDAAARLAGAEIRGLESQGDKAAQFYQRHFHYVVKALLPVAEAWEAETGCRADVIPLASDLCAEALAEVLAESAPAVLRRWNGSRAGQIENRIKGLFSATTKTK